MLWKIIAEEVIFRIEKEERNYSFMIDRIKSDTIEYCEKELAPLIEIEFIQMGHSIACSHNCAYLHTEKYNDKILSYYQVNGYYTSLKKYFIDLDFMREYLKKFCYTVELKYSYSGWYDNPYKFAISIDPKCLK